MPSNQPKLQRLKLSDIKLIGNNPRSISKSDFAALCQDIKRDPAFLRQRPPLINKSKGKFICYAGNQRTKAAIEVGYKELECWVEENVPKKIQEERMLKDNLHRGQWDFSMLQTFDASFLNDVGFSSDELNKIFSDQVLPADDDFNLDEELGKIEKPVTKLGDVYQLGSHRLLCGDATKVDEVNKLCGSKRMTLCITDPPYNVNYEGATKAKLKIQNDNMSSEKFYQFLLDAFSSVSIVMADGAMMYIFHADTEGVNFRNAMTSAGFYFSQSCVWIKNSLVMGRQDYHWQHEPILVGWKPGGKHRWFGGRSQTTVWNFDKPLRSQEHPTMKPIDLVSYPIANSTKPGDTVIDTFAGSGSTLIACEQMKRTAYIMELDPKYCDVIVTRWEKLTGKKAKLLK